MADLAEYFSLWSTIIGGRYTENVVSKEAVELDPSGELALAILECQFRRYTQSSYISYQQVLEKTDFREEGVPGFKHYEETKTLHQHLQYEKPASKLKEKVYRTLAEQLGQQEELKIRDLLNSLSALEHLPIMLYRDALFSLQNMTIIRFGNATQDFVGECLFSQELRLYPSLQSLLEHTASFPNGTFNVGFVYHREKDHTTTYLAYKQMGAVYLLKQPSKDRYIDSYSDPHKSVEYCSGGLWLPYYNLVKPCDHGYLDMVGKFAPQQFREHYPTKSIWQLPVEYTANLLLTMGLVAGKFKQDTSILLKGDSRYVYSLLVPSISGNTHLPAKVDSIFEDALGQGRVYTLEEMRSDNLAASGIYPGEVDQSQLWLEHKFIDSIDPELFNLIQFTMSQGDFPSLNSEGKLQMSSYRRSCFETNELNMIGSLEDLKTKQVITARANYVFLIKTFARKYFDNPGNYQKRLFVLKGFINRRINDIVSGYFENKLNGASWASIKEIKSIQDYVRGSLTYGGTKRGGDVVTCAYTGSKSGYALVLSPKNGDDIAEMFGVAKSSLDEWEQHWKPHSPSLRHSRPEKGFSEFCSWQSRLDYTVTVYFSKTSYKRLCGGEQMHIYVNRFN